TWPMITSSGFNMRWRQVGSVHDHAGLTAFSNNQNQLLYILGVMNSPVGNYLFKLLNPTINLMTGNFNDFPLLLMTNTNRVINYVTILIKLAKDDWDSFETSWDFIKH